jgi:cell division protein FtsA
MKRGAVTGSEIPMRKMDTIVQQRLKEMFTLVGAHLKSINRARLLPAGIVITGGGSGMASTQEIAKAILKLPSQVGQIGHMPRTASVDATWAVAYGLCKWAYGEDMSEKSSSLGEAFGGFWDSIKRGFRSLLP